MANFKEKSDSNNEAAEVLFEKELYSSLVHCAYYSVFQYMKYILWHDYSINYKKQEKTIYNKDWNKELHGSHKRLITLFISTATYRDKYEVAKMINELKTYRHHADYEDLEIDDQKAKKSMELLSDLRKTLENNLITK